MATKEVCVAETLGSEVFMASRWPALRVTCCPIEVEGMADGVRPAVPSGLVGDVPKRAFVLVVEVACEEPCVVCVSWEVVHDSGV